MGPRFPGGSLGDSCSDIEIAGFVLHCKMGCAPVRGAVCAHRLSCHLLSAFRRARLGLGSHLRAGAPVLCYHAKKCSTPALPAVTAELTRYQNPDKWWGYIPAAAVFVDSLVLGVISHLWLPHQTLLVQMVLAAGPQLRKWAKEGWKVLGLIFKCQALFRGCLIVRSSRMGSEFPFSSKWSCFF